MPTYIVKYGFELQQRHFYLHFAWFLALQITQKLNIPCIKKVHQTNGKVPALPALSGRKISQMRKK
jgi:hypothetical protein